MRIPEVKISSAKALMSIWGVTSALMFRDNAGRNLSLQHVTYDLLMAVQIKAASQKGSALIFLAIGPAKLEKDVDCVNGRRYRKQYYLFIIASISLTLSLLKPKA
jgi:hypothetical protein